MTFKIAVNATTLINEAGQIDVNDACISRGRLSRIHRINRALYKLRKKVLKLQVEVRRERLLTNTRTGPVYEPEQRTLEWERSVLRRFQLQLRATGLQLTEAITAAELITPAED